MSSAGNGKELIAAFSSTLFNAGYNRYTYSTAVGGSTIDDILARITAEAEAVRTSTVIIWDGDSNGYGTPALYLGKIDQILAITGTKYVVILRPGTRGPSADGTVSQLTLDMETIQAGIIFRGVTTFNPVTLIDTLSTGTAQDLLDISARVILASELQGDLTHLLTPAKTLVGNQLATTVIGAGI